MNAVDAKRFNQLVTGLCLTFGREPEPLLLDVYWLTLKSWDLPDFEAACAHLLQTAKFMPRPADFVELRKAGRMTPGEAFAKARQILGMALRSEIPSLASGDARIDAAIRAIGGWQVLAMSTSENIGFLERRFVEHFEQICDAQDTREALPQLTSELHPRLAREHGPVVVQALLQEPKEP